MSSDVRPSDFKSLLYITEYSWQDYKANVSIPGRPEMSDVLLDLFGCDQVLG